MPSTTGERIRGILTSVAVKAPCKTVATSPVALYGEQAVGGAACVAGDRVLLAGQANPVENGIWIVDTGSWSRALDFNGARDVVKGTLVLVAPGSAGRFWQVTTEDPIYPGTTAVNLSPLDPSTLLVDAGHVAFNPTLDYPPGTLGRTVSDREWSPCDHPWYAKFDNVTDDTDAILACMTALTAAGGGTMVLPRGTAVCNNLVYTYPDNETTLNIRGQGENATVLRKSNGDATPVIHLKSSSNTVPASIQSKWADFSVVGNAKAGPGIQVTLLARFTMRNIAAQACSVGLNNLGSLIFSVYDCTFLYNTNGYVSRKQGPTRCNLVKFFGGTVASNTGYGLDIGDSSGLKFYETDFESNGTAGNTSSGDVVIRSSVDDETGSAQIGFFGTHHEQNLGKGFTAEPAIGLILTLKGARFDSNASGTALNIGAISTLTLDEVITNNTINVNSVVFNLIGGSLTDLNDNSTYQNYQPASSNDGLVLLNVKAGALGGLSVDTVGLVRIGIAGLVSEGDVEVKGGNTLLTTAAALANAAAANTATLTNSPKTGNPTKWIQINDAGVTRWIPTWSA